MQSCVIGQAVWLCVQGHSTIHQHLLRGRSWEQEEGRAVAALRFFCLVYTSVLHGEMSSINAEEKKTESFSHVSINSICNSRTQ